MGMFDWYIPDSDLNCPNCGSLLEDWQGKDAACALFVWKQGFKYPIEQKGNDCNIDIDKRNKFRLPEFFKIYNYCDMRDDYRIVADCKTENEVWVEVIEIRLEKRQKLPKKWFNQA